MLLVRHPGYCRSLHWLREVLVILLFFISGLSQEEMKREEERREAEESTQMAAEEQRQKELFQAQKEEEERQRKAEEQCREEASELLRVFLCPCPGWLGRSDCEKSTSKEKLKSSHGWPRKNGCNANVCRQKKRGDAWRMGNEGGRPCVFSVQRGRFYSTLV